MTLAVQDFHFMGGSLGMAAGEAFIKGAETALEKKTPYVVFAASGGARMQEGILSLMQLPRTTVAVRMLRGRPALFRRADQPDHGRRHRLLRHAGRHPYRRARRADRLRRAARDRADHREKLPDGFQRAEYLKDHGMVDMVVHRHEIPATLARLGRLLMKQPAPGDVVKPPPGRRSRLKTRIAGGPEPRWGRPTRCWRASSRCIPS
jgi:acetyl-CoA carboxylase carboxyl transferase subunit beta